MISTRATELSIFIAADRFITVLEKKTGKMSMQKNIRAPNWHMDFVRKFSKLLILYLSSPNHFQDE